MRASLAGCPFFCLLAIALFSGCWGRTSSVSSSGLANIDSIMPLQYASGFEIAYSSDYKIVTVFDAWSVERRPLQRYYLYSLQGESALPVHSDGISLRVPFSKVALGSCTQVEFVRELVPLEVVKGMCNTESVYNAGLRELIASGSVIDLGDALDLNVEKVLSLGAEAFFAGSYSPTNPKYELLSRSGTAIVHDYEWKESDLLGRAEWIKFVACFFDKEKEADSLFCATVRRYDDLKRLAASDSLQTSVTVLSGENFRGTWYLPGGRSYVAQLFRDAGADYRFEQDTTTGSLSLSLEQVLRDFHDADVWVGVSATDLQELLAKDPHYEVFEAWKRGKVYAYDRRSTETGGNDYWESAVAHPDAILSDFVKICHPSLLQDVTWNYIRKLQPCAGR